MAYFSINNLDVFVYYTDEGGIECVFSWTILQVT